MYHKFDSCEIYDECWGPTSKIVKVKKSIFSCNETIFFIEFLPGTLYALTGIPQKELINKICILSDIDKSLSLSLRDAILFSKNADDWINNVERILIGKLHNYYKNHFTLYTLINLINKKNGNIPIKELAYKEFISERTLGRIFDKYIGLNVKTFERVLKINKAIIRLKGLSHGNLTDISHEYGYYDQSHFIHDFKDFCGTIPTLFIQNRDAFYNESFKF